MNCADAICGRPWPRCQHHVPCFTNTLSSCPHAMVLRAPHSPKSLSLTPIPVSRGDRPRRWVASLLPNLGLFPAPLLPTPLGPTLSGERPMALGVPRECCAGARGNQLTALARWRHWETLEGAAVWSSDKTWNSNCWPQYWVIPKWAAGQARPFLVL